YAGFPVTGKLGPGGRRQQRRPRAAVKENEGGQLLFITFFSFYTRMRHFEQCSWFKSVSIYHSSLAVVYLAGLARLSPVPTTVCSTATNKERVSLVLDASFFI
ncbi:MAP kinase interacting serine/threonine kinase 2a, partial [Triplophysa rosa]